MEDTEECRQFNTENIGLIYNKQLPEHIEDLKELSATLAQDAREYRDNGRQVNTKGIFQGGDLEKFYISESLRANISQSVLNDLSLTCPL